MFLHTLFVDSRKKECKIVFIKTGETDMDTDIAIYERISVWKEISVQFQQVKRKLYLEIEQKRRSKVCFEMSL